MSASLVARREGVSACLLYQWRKLERGGALTAVSAGESVLPASWLAAARAEIAKLQLILGKKTLENEILKEAVEKRFGSVEAVPDGRTLEFLTDNRAAYIANDWRAIAKGLDLKPVTTPVCSP
jgi:transposase-like protein